MRPGRRSAEREELAAHLATVVGGLRIVREHARPHGDAYLLHFTDATGSWVAKWHANARPFQRELRAYRSWAPALGDNAPGLRHADEDERVLIMTAIPGQPAGGPDAHHRAGAILRRLHDAQPPRPARGYANECVARLDELLARGAHLFGAREIDFVRAEVRGLESLSTPDRVPCHMDYTPTNWLVDQEGTLRVVDFAGARLQPWVRDLNRLYFSEWWDTPEYGPAFMAGYGRDLTGDDLEFLRRTGCLTAVSRILWGTEHALTSPVADGRRILQALMSGQR